MCSRLTMDTKMRSLIVYCLHAINVIMVSSLLTSSIFNTLLVYILLTLNKQVVA